jgi:DNA-binding transcriptional LysR family regulator
MPELRSLEIFYWVAQLRSFRGAAERLNTTQPAVSQRIAALEAELGVRLLDRGARSVVTTAQGRRLLDYAERMLRLRAEMLEAIAGAEAVGGVLRLGVAETIVHTWLSRFIERAHALFPAVTLDIEVDVTPNLRTGLVGHTLDLAFLMGPVAEPSIANLPLCRYPLAFAASPRLPLGPGPVTIDALLGWPIITYPRSTRPTMELLAALRMPGAAAPRLFASTSLATILRMARDGIGISVIPPVVAARELADGTLCLVATDITPPAVAFTASWPTGPEEGLARRLAELAQSVAAAAGHA